MKSFCLAIVKKRSSIELLKTERGMYMKNRVINETQDLTYLKWSHIRSSSGTAGTFLNFAVLPILPKSAYQPPTVGEQYFRGRNSDRKGAKSHAVRRVRQTSKSGLAGGWGGPNERI